VRRPNGTVRVLTYDAAGQVTRIEEKDANGALIVRHDLGYNSAGQIDYEFVAPLTKPWSEPARSATYDLDNRLASVNGVAVAHDADGNLTRGPLLDNQWADYTYDARNRLRGVSAGGAMPAVTYEYDAGGHRTALVAGGRTYRFVVNPEARWSQVLVRVRPDGRQTYYVYGLGLLYQVDQADNIRAYHYDYRGSTVAITDATGKVTDRIEYGAYGRVSARTGSTDTPFLFNGRYGVQTDPNGLLYMRARYYHPSLCRFLNPDPSGFAGGMNLYAYANGNPVSFLDPFGLCAGEPTGNYWVPSQWAKALDGGIQNVNQWCQGSSTFWNFEANMAASVASGMADMLRFGDGLGSVSSGTASSGWDYAIGGAQDIARGCGLAGMAGGGGLGAAARAGVNRGVATATDQAAFWSGRQGMNRAAAEASSLTTLERTPAGIALESQDLFSKLPYSEAIKPWEALSEQFASQAKGTVNAWTGGASPESIWNRVELRTLLRNREIQKIVIHDATQPWKTKIIYP